MLLIREGLLPDFLEVTIGLTCSGYSLGKLCINSFIDGLSLLTEWLLYGFMPTKLLFILLLLLCGSFLLLLLCGLFFLFLRRVCSAFRKLLLRCLIFPSCFICGRWSGCRWFFFLSCLLSAFLQKAREWVQGWLGTIHHVFLGIYSLHLSVVFFEELLQVHIFLLFLLPS